MAAGTVRVRRISATGYDVLEAPTARRHRRDPGARRAALPVAQGDHGRAAARRSSRGRWPTSGWTMRRRSAARSRRRRSSTRGSAAGAGRDRDRPRAAGRRRGARDRRLPRRAEDHLMGALWVVAEPRSPTAAWRGSAPRLATLGADARGGGGRRGRRDRGRGASPAAAAAELATYLPASSGPSPSRPPPTMPGRAVAARPGRARSPRRMRPMRSCVGAGADGRDLAGAVSALTGSGVLVNATASTWTDGGPSVEMSVFGGKLITTSRVHRRPRASSPSGRMSRPPTPARDRPGASRRRDRRQRPAPCRPSASSTGSARPARRRRSRRRGSSSPAVAASAVRTGSAIVERARRGARRRRRGDARGGRFGLDPVQPADRPDRQDRQARALPRARASAARSSTRSGCRRRARSSPSTAMRTRRSPSSPTCSWSATCSRSGPPSSTGSRARGRG